MKPTIFSRMSALATRHSAINLSQGFPDFPVDERLASHLYDAAREGYNQYAPAPGHPMLREAISADWQARYGLAIDPQTELTITPGATYAIYTAFQAVLSPGDEAILLEPAYDSYIPNILAAGGKPVAVRLTAPDFRPDWNAIKKAITSRTRAIIINTPHNPTGVTWSAEDWDTLAGIIAGRNISILSDEVYEQLVYDGNAHASVLHHPELREKAFVLFSFGKAFHNTGWKIGYCVAPQAMTDSFRNLHQFLAFSVNTPAQVALARYLTDSRPEAPATMLQEKRDLFLSLLAETPFEPLAPAGGSYFQVARYTGISKMKDTDFAEWLTVEKGVAAIPVSAFYSNGHDDSLLRFCFAKKTETLRSAAKLLAQVI